MRCPPPRLPEHPTLHHAVFWGCPLREKRHIYRPSCCGSWESADAFQTRKHFRRRRCIFVLKNAPLQSRKNIGSPGTSCFFKKRERLSSWGLPCHTPISQTWKKVSTVSHQGLLIQSDSVTLASSRVGARGAEGTHGVRIHVTKRPSPLIPLLAAAKAPLPSSAGGVCGAKQWRSGPCRDRRPPWLKSWA